jgi:pimeloyl-ACP methyl ester carboxylesterase
MAPLPQGRLVVVQEAGHLIPQEDPVAVRETILEIVDTAAVTP